MEYRKFAPRPRTRNTRFTKHDKWQQRLEARPRPRDFVGSDTALRQYATWFVSVRRDHTNANFRTATAEAPEFCEPGGRGEACGREHFHDPGGQILEIPVARKRSAERYAPATLGTGLAEAAAATEPAT
jgi:hypothetical protein